MDGARRRADSLQLTQQIRLTGGVAKRTAALISDFRMGHFKVDSSDLQLILKQSASYNATVSADLADALERSNECGRGWI